MSSRRITIAGLVVLAAAALAGCEKDQASVATSKLASQPPWDGAGGPFVAAGWTVGDKASWLAGMEQRTLRQNEYLRIR